MNKFYIYMYLDFDNIPFYIGKGKDGRYKVQEHLYTRNNNRLLKNKIRKVGVPNVRIHFLHKNLTEKESFYWERYWIKYIGRKDKKEGSLCNLTDGGEGISGMPRSEETKRKISDAQKGKEVSAETCEKLSKAHKGQIAWNKGIPMAKEQKEKLSKITKGRTSPNKDKKFSKEWCINLSRSHAVFTDDNIREIRKLRKQKISGRRIAEMFNTDKYKIYAIALYKIYKHVK